MKPQSVSALNQAVTAHRAGDLRTAVKLYRKVLLDEPREPNALRLLGVARMQQNRLDDALALIARSIKVAPASADGHYYLGMLSRQRGDKAQATAALRQCIAIDPSHENAHLMLAGMAREAARPDEAAAHFTRALAINPRSLDGLVQYAALHQDLGRPEEALALLDRAAAIAPRDPTLHHRRGRVLRLLRLFEEALTSFDAALQLDPKMVDALYERAAVLCDLNKPDEAARCFRAVIDLRPDSLDAKLAHCISALPILYMEEAEIAARRAVYEERLRALVDEVRAKRLTDATLSATGSGQAFYLAYQGYNDRALQMLKGALICDVMADRAPADLLATPPAPDEPLRIGIVSGFFRNHSNWKIPIQGWLTGLDRTRFRIFGYHTGARTDDITREAVRSCERFVQGPLSIEAWRDTIAADKPHVLIYPEVGMDHTAFLLAAMRLAPVQCNSWGHPDTSGYPTLDYYLGCDLMEPEDGQDAYSETLVRLPGLSAPYAPPEIAPVALSRRDIGLRDDAIVYCCNQALSKYLPQHDAVLIRIAEEVGDCQFAFLANAASPRVNDLLKQRLERAFAAQGLDAARHCVVAVGLSPEQFAAATALCDVFLDSIGWSGCNTVLESLRFDLPIVTVATELMRGRHAAAILTLMGLSDMVAATIEDYVAAAVRLGRDLAERMTAAARIRAGKHRVFGDRSAIAALEAFLERVCRG